MFREGIADPAFKALGVIVQSGANDNFYLARGTSAAIQLGHRLSVDLDFFSSKKFEQNSILYSLEQVGAKITNQQVAPGTLHFELEGTNISFLYYKYPLLEKTAEFHDTELAQLLDIGLMKITAIASRGAKKDFVDLHYILKKYPLKTLLERFEDKFPPQDINLYHYIKSLTFFDDAENDPDPIFLKECSWKIIKQSIVSEVERIFPNLT